jgi:hypothetical protein
MFVPRIGAVWYFELNYSEAKAAPSCHRRAALVSAVFGMPAASQDYINERFTTLG